jgi:hypothetical protein
MRLMTIISASMLVLAAGAPVALAGETANPVTVNDYTPAQKAKAVSAAEAKGYTNLEVTMAQAGDLFFKGQAGGHTYLLTVTPDGEVYPSVPLEG